MKHENFHIMDSIAIEYDHSYIDLHNNYDFSGLTYEQRSCQVTLTWHKKLQKWAERETYEVVTLVFDSVSIFGIHPRDPEMPFTEDSCVDYIGYLHPDDIGLMEGFLPLKLSAENYHMVLGFESGMVIKLYAESVKVIADPLTNFV